MSFDLKQSLKFTQQLLMTPQLQQAIKLLQLSRIELEEFVADQLIENPVLETEADSSDELSSEKQEQGEANITDSLDTLHNPEIEDPFEERVSSEFASRKFEEEYNFEDFISNPISLQEHLQQQIREINFSEEEAFLAYKLIGYLNSDGFIDIDLEAFSKEEKVSLDCAEGVLDTMQRFDPTGVCARGLSESLLIQIRESKLTNGIVEKIVKDHLKDLEQRNYAAISKALSIGLDDVYKNAALIAGLNPAPGRFFGEDRIDFIVPDAYVYMSSDKKWVVVLNEENLPKLNVAEFYSHRSKGTSDNVEKKYLQDKIRDANWLIKSIEQRQRTIRKVVESIVEKQLEFFEKGTKFLKPMILKDVAEDIEMHESTVSRVTNGKYVHTPRGVFELKYFFSSSIQSDEEGVSSVFVKEAIREIVSKENVKKPFSDQKIVQILSEKGVKLARRTVAKYREQMGILPSSKRKKLF